MTQSVSVEVCALMIALALAACWAGAAQGAVGAAYLDRLLASNRAAVADLADYVRFADMAAALLVRDPDGPGPSLWLAGDSGFVTEGYNRAGGLTIAKRLPSPEGVAVGDVVLVGSLHGDDAQTQELVAGCAEAGGLVILFAPRAAVPVVVSAELLAMLDEHARAALAAGYLFLDAHADAPGDAKLPTASPATAQSLWAFTGELVSAMMRRAGRMPPVFRSVMVPGGREHNATLRGRRWEGPAGEAHAPGVAGRTYLARVANWMRRLRATQADEFAAAGRRAAEVMGGGGTVWVATLGHLSPFQLQQVAEGEPGFTALPGAEPDRVPELVKPGDLVLYIGYYEPLGPWVETVHEVGAQIVTVVSGTYERPASRMGADINICGCWPYGDVTVNRHPYASGWDMLPPSGVIQSAAFWMLLAETRAAMR
ncbi:MAG: hypothetical protein AB7Y46_08295 [Armatimonadota bacterium]